MPDRDVLSEARHIENPPSLAEKAATTLLKPVRAGLGFLANVAAKNVMLSEFVPNTDLPPPEMSNPLKKDANGRVLMDGANQPIRDSRQLQVDKMAFQPANGPPQQVEGWVMPAEPGKPTMVFFGGSNFNRNDEDYTNAISMMANDAKARGLGFAVYDYPEGVNEEMARQFVDQMQNHLQDDLGMPLSQQAYCGYSQGSFMASYAAANNPDSAGLQITDGFSSARQYQKEKMDAGAGPLSALIEKRQITEHWDNIPLAQDIAVRRDQQHPDARMPVVAVYTDQHDFGVEGNLHMTPLIENLQGEHGGVVVNLSHEQDHLKMLGTIEHGDGARQLMDQAATHVANANRQLIGNGQTLAAQQGPAVHTPSVREQLASRLTQRFHQRCLSFGEWLCRRGER
jgi:hypothetical protein